MHCYFKQLIQTLCVNDHRCVFLTNQQADEENNQLSTVFARSRDYPSGKFAPERISDSADAEKANKRSDRVDLKGKENYAFHPVMTDSARIFPLSILDL